ncbi:MAG: YkuS family protein [Cellulosilyticaceae bacterium]
MIIAIEKDLEHIKDYIQQQTAYEVYTIGTYDGAVDVVIYAKQYTSNDFSQYQYESIQDALEQHTDISKGTLMINAQQKTPVQVLESIKIQLEHQKSDGY